MHPFSLPAHASPASTGSPCHDTSDQPCSRSCESLSTCRPDVLPSSWSRGACCSCRICSMAVRAHNGRQGEGCGCGVSNPGMHPAPGHHVSAARGAQRAPAPCSMSQRSTRSAAMELEICTHHMCAASKHAYLQHPPTCLDHVGMAHSPYIQPCRCQYALQQLPGKSSVQHAHEAAQHCKALACQQHHDASAVAKTACPATHPWHNNVLA